MFKKRLFLDYSEKLDALETKQKKGKLFEIVHSFWMLSKAKSYKISRRLCSKTVLLQLIINVQE